MIDSIKYIEVGDKKYPIAFTLNVMEEIQNKFGSMGKWGEALQPEISEPKIKDLKWTFAQFINEGIDIENEENGGDRSFVTEKQVGRIISAIGMKQVSDTILKTTLQSTDTGEEKNEMAKQSQME